MAKKRTAKKTKTRRKPKAAPKPAPKPSTGPEYVWIRDCNGLRIERVWGTPAAVDRMLKDFDQRKPRRAPHRT